MIFESRDLREAEGSKYAVQAAIFLDVILASAHAGLAGLCSGFGKHISGHQVTHTKGMWN
jgi:hypothetical protein